MKYRKFLALLLVAVFAAAVAGCGNQPGHNGQEETVQMEKVLTERQISILKEMGLPVKYGELDLSQQSAIDAIEALLVHLEKTHQEEFDYLGYVAPGGVEREHLIACVRGGSRNNPVTLYRWTENGTVHYEDNYHTVKAKPFFEEAVAEFVAGHVQPAHTKIFCKVYDARGEITKQNAAANVSATVYLFVNGDQVSMEDCEALGEACRQWLLDNCNGLSSSVLLMRTVTDEILLTTEENYTSRLWSDIYSLRKEYIVNTSGEVRVLE